MKEGNKQSNHFNPFPFSQYARKANQTVYTFFFFVLLLV